MNKIIITHYILKTSEIKEIMKRHFSIPAQFNVEFRNLGNFDFQFSVTGERKNEGLQTK